MKLEIDRFLIQSDPYNFQLYEYGEKVNPKDKSVSKGYSLIGYYPRIEVALKKIIDLEIKAVEEANADKIVEAIKRVGKSIEMAVQKYHLQNDRVREDKDEKEV